jgi:hypothetical protein
MKKVIFFSVMVLVFFACKKTNNSTLPAGTKQINGDLHYDNVLGGLGLYYKTDSNTTMIFKDQFANDKNDSLEFLKYIYSVGVNTTMKYIDLDSTGCFDGNPSLCGFPVVQIVSFTIR